MSAGDAFIRTRGRRLPSPAKEVEPRSFGPLVSQGARSAGTPWLRTRTVDDAIREARGRERWRPII